MLSYVFKNRKNTQKDIADVCNSIFDLRSIRRKNDDLFMANEKINILISKKYTHIVLSNEDVNIQKIQDFF